MNSQEEPVEIPVSTQEYAKNPEYDAGPFGGMLGAKKLRIDGNYGERKVVEMDFSMQTAVVSKGIIPQFERLLQQQKKQCKDQIKNRIHELFLKDNDEWGMIYANSMRKERMRRFTSGSGDIEAEDVSVFQKRPPGGKKPNFIEFPLYVKNVENAKLNHPDLIDLRDFLCYKPLKMNSLYGMYGAKSSLTPL